MKQSTGMHEMSEHWIDTILCIALSALIHCRMHGFLVFSLELHFEQVPCDVSMSESHFTRHIVSTTNCVHIQTQFAEDPLPFILLKD